MNQQLPADRRVTPEALADYGTRRGPCDGTELTTCSLAWGAVVAWLSFPVLLLAAGSFGGPWTGWLGVQVLTAVPFVLVLSFLPVACLGFPLGMLLAHLMRGVAHQWCHLAAFAGAGALVGGVMTIALGGTGFSIFVPVAAAAAMVGRAVLWRRFEPRSPSGRARAPQGAA